MTGELDLEPPGLCPPLRSAWLWRGVLGAELCLARPDLSIPGPGEAVTPPYDRLWCEVAEAGARILEAEPRGSVETSGLVTLARWWLGLGLGLRLRLALWCSCDSWETCVTPPALPCQSLSPEERRGPMSPDLAVLLPRPGV